MNMPPDAVPPVPLEIAGYDYGAIETYERMLLEQAHLRFAGLWFRQGHFFAVCPELDSETRAADGEPLTMWFAKYHIMCAPISLMPQAPEGSVRVALRSRRERLVGIGRSQTRRDIFFDLHVALPKDFPDFEVLEKDGGGLPIQLRFERPLEPDEWALVEKTYTDLRLIRPMVIEVGPFTPEFRHPAWLDKISPDLDLLPSRRLPQQFTRAVRWKLEDDEEFWRANRERLYDDDVEPVKCDAVGVTRSSRTASCIVDLDRGNVHNIRSYLSLYDRVILVAPETSKYDRALSQLHATQKELVELAALGKLVILFPYSMDAYPVSLCCDMAETVPSAMLLSRRLGVATACDTRGRFPLLYAPFDTEERYEFLNVARRLTATAEPQLKQWLTALCQVLEDSWLLSEVALHTLGATGPIQTGIGALAAHLVQSIHGIDRRLEFLMASPAVEWGAALGAAVSVPSDCPYSSLVAAMYSLLRSGAVPLTEARAFSMADDILAIASDAPLIEFAKAFHSNEVARFRNFVLSLAKWNQDDDYAAQAIRDFNTAVRSYERKPNRIQSFSLASLVPAIVTATASANNGPDDLKKYLPLGGWLLQMLLALISQQYAGQVGAVGRVWDWANSKLANSRPEAVLVSRMKARASTL
jgi:hypothetical protein